MLLLALVQNNRIKQSTHHPQANTILAHQYECVPTSTMPEANGIFYNALGAELIAIGFQDILSGLVHASAQFIHCIFFQSVHRPVP